MRHLFRRWLTPAITVGFVAALAASVPTSTATRAELDTLLTRYDREPDGPERERLAERIDAFAHQKYATVSRLYWHVDLASAKAEARAQGRPILHLRMLGRLDEDLSCANSRLFRATLYANRDVSHLLRDKFVLYWSSERPVPRVTVDYGDGRALERTVTGNSAHYVLDEDGNVLDVLPGLYAPVVFRQELGRALELAARVRHRSVTERARIVADQHRQHISAAERDRVRVGNVPGMSGLQRLTQAPNETALVAAERVTFTKSGIELRDLRVIARELVPDVVPGGALEVWSRAGRMLYGIGGPTPPLSSVLDGSSRSLVARLHQSGSQPSRAADEQLGVIVARLEQTIVADTALNQLYVRPQISREIVWQAGRIDFATLNAWIYDRVFRTPSQDPWLGLLQRDVFTGLPGDGVVLRSERGRR